MNLSGSSVVFGTGYSQVTDFYNSVGSSLLELSLESLNPILIFVLLIVIITTIISSFKSSIFKTKGSQTKTLR